MDKEVDIPEEFDVPNGEEWQQQQKLRKGLKRLLSRNSPPPKGTVSEQKPQDPHPQESPEKRVKDSMFWGKYMMRDLPLFKYEIVAYLGMIFLAVAGYFLERTEIMPGAMGKFMLPAVMLPIGIWFVKKVLYMPTKTRVPHLHIYKSRVVELSVKDIKKGYIMSGRGEQAKKIWLTKLNRHIEASTGKPFVVTSDLHGENLDLLKDDKPDMRSEDFSSILEVNTAVTTKNVMNKMLKTVQPSMQNPLFLLLIINLFMVAVLLIKSFGFLEFIKGG